MNRRSGLVAASLWRWTVPVGMAMIVAALSFAATTLWDARTLDSTLGEVVGIRDKAAESGPRPELLVVFQTAEGETLMFAEAIGTLAPEVGDRVTVWYSEGDAPRAMIARQRFTWPILLLPIGLALAGFGLHQRNRLNRSSKADDPEIAPNDVKLDGH